MCSAATARARLTARFESKETSNGPCEKEDKSVQSRPPHRRIAGRRPDDDRNGRVVCDPERVRSAVGHAPSGGPPRDRLVHHAARSETANLGDFARNHQRAARPRTERQATRDARVEQAHDGQ